VVCTIIIFLHKLFNFYFYFNRAIRKMKSNSESSLLAAVRSSREEKILEVDGTVTTQPVLEHVGISTWPGKCGKKIHLSAMFLKHMPLQFIIYT